MTLSVATSPARFCSTNADDPGARTILIDHSTAFRAVLIIGTKLVKMDRFYLVSFLTLLLTFRMYLSTLHANLLLTFTTSY